MRYWIVLFTLASFSGCICSLSYFDSFENDTSLVVPTDNILSYIKSQILPILSSLKNETDDSLKCENKIISLIESLTDSKDNLMGLKFLDALGKPPSGFLDGNTVFMGSYDACLASDLSSNGYKSCKIKASMTLKSQVVTPLTWTVCFPSECRGGNYTSLTQVLLKLINKDPKLLHIAEDSVHAACDIDYQFTIGSYVAITLVSAIVFMVLVGTAWEPVSILVSSMRWSHDKKVLVNSDQLEPEAILSDNNPEVQQYYKSDPAKSSALGEFFQCFSLPRTFGVLLNTATKEGQILCLNGIRVISINWVVLGHIYYIGMNAADLSNYVVMWRKHSMSIIYNALPAVDTFFFLSGLLVSLLLLKDLARTHGRFRALGYYLHRYVRLTAPFLVVTLVQGFLAHIYIRGPFEDILAHGHESCQKYWWTNILYINNLVPWNKTEICVSQTWYLSNDFQFFMVAPLFIWLLYKNPKIGVLLCLGAFYLCVVFPLVCLEDLMVIATHHLRHALSHGVAVSLITLTLSCAAAGVITYLKNLGPTTVFDPDAVNFVDFKMLYDKPWIRCPPYLVGILGGWFCYKHIDSVKLYVSTLSLIKRLLVGSLMWIITGTVEYWVVFGLHYDMEMKTHGKELNLTQSVMYETFARSAWSIALLIQIIMCQGGLGGIINKVLSWRVWVVLSRLTFSVYLLHYIIVQSFVVQLRHPFFFKPDFEVGVIYAGILAISYAGATLLFTFVEQPVTFFERLTYRN